MEKIKVLFYAIYFAISDYFTQSTLHKAFFWTLTPMLLLFILGLIFQAGFLWVLLIISIIPMLYVSILMTREQRRKFLEEFHKMKKETSDDEEATTSFAEDRYLRKKETQFRYTIFTKVAFIILLVVLLVGLM